MIVEEIKEDIAAAIKEIMKREGVADYRYEIDGQSDAGDNYMGEVYFLRVESEENEKKTLHLVLKTAKRSKDLREAVPVEVFYSRELFMYSDVFTAYRKFIREVAPNFDFQFVPKVYWINDELKRETIVLENLKASGFSLYDRKKPWNFEHSSFAMRQYGKLHALSIALKDQKPEVFRELEKNMGNVSNVWEKKMDMKSFFTEPFEHVMDLLRKNGKEDLVKKYDGVLDEAEQMLLKAADEDDKVAICHMDCWNNNFMFKYENDDNSSPSDLRMLDFQLSVVDSPAKDLSYNIYATCDNTCLSRFDELMKIYHDTLKESLRILGSDPEKFFSMADLRRHWRKYGLYALFFCITIIKIELLEKENAPKIEDMANSENMMDVFKVKVTDQDEYDRRIYGVFAHFAENFL